MEFRIEKLKKESVEAVQEVCVQRARYLTEAYRENEADPMIIRRAKAIYNVMDKMTLFIENGSCWRATRRASSGPRPYFRNIA
jgi:formate C-acetyltransferase